MTTAATATERSPMGFTEFVGFIAACMALNALAIDVMLPALPMLHADFGLSDPNRKFPPTTRPIVSHRPDCGRGHRILDRPYMTVVLGDGPLGRRRSGTEP